MIDRTELKALLQSTDGGLQAVTLVQALLYCTVPALQTGQSVSSLCLLLWCALHLWQGAPRYRAAPVSYGAVTLTGTCETCAGLD